MLWLTKIMAWGTRQPALGRWLAVLGLFAIPLAIRLLLGRVYGAVPALTFYPVTLMVAALFGWVEASVFLALSVTAGVLLFLPPGMYLMPIGWVFVGGVSIAIVGALRRLAHELAEANERQRLLFRELQHRLANTLQSVVATFNNIRRKIDQSPEEAKAILDEGGRRILASADVHRRLYDPSLFEKDLQTILLDAVSTVIDAGDVDIKLNIEPLKLTFDQICAITMLVIEFANNAQKHVFERKLGSNFTASLRRLPDGRAVLSVTDDGPGWLQTERVDEQQTLGRSIITALASQLAGVLSIQSEQGTEVCVTFPLLA